MRILTLIIALFLTCFTYGQIAFFHLYTNGGDDDIKGITQLEDSSYVITGSSDSYPGGSGSEAFLLKMDSTGVPIWSHHYGGLEMDEGRSVSYLPGVGFYIAGTTASYGAGAYDFYLVKTDLNGTTEWERSYGKEGWERLYGGALCRDSGMFLVGETLSNPTNNSDIYMVRTDKNGDTLWTKTMGGLGSDGLEAISAFDDSTFYVVGHIFVDDSLYAKAYIAKYHEDGTLIWSDTIGAAGNYYLKDVSVVSTEVFGGGYRNGPGVNGNDVYYFRIAHDGVVLGEITQAIPGDYKIQQVCSYNDDSKRYSAYSYFTATSQPDGDDLAIARCNYGFTWEVTALNLYYLQPDVVNEMVRTSDGGAIAVGNTNSEGIGVHHGWVCKIGPNELYANWDAPHTQFGLVVGIDEQAVLDQLSVYPNPTNGTINIQSPVNNQIQLEISNGLGQVLFLDCFQGNASYDLSQFGTGIYYLKTAIDGVSTVRKIVLKH